MQTRIDLDLREILLKEERTARDVKEMKESINELLSKIDSRSAVPEWLNLEQVAALKGVNFNTIKTCSYLRPGAGNPKMQRYCGGRLVFHRDTVVLPWLSVTDEKLEDYLINVCGIKNIPDKFLKKIRKAKSLSESDGLQEVGVC